ncbi:MAG: rhodanese-like domain-containing protein [Bdellovibrionota bacterium]
MILFNLKLLRIAAGFILAIGIWGCNTAPKPTIATSQTEVLVKEPSVAAMVKPTTIIVDVRPGFEANGMAIPHSRPLSPSDLGLKPNFLQNDFGDIAGILRRQGIRHETPVVMVGDISRDLPDMGYVGLVLWSLGVEKIDATDIRHWRQRPPEGVKSEIGENLTTNLLTEPRELEIDHQSMDQCTKAKCLCVAAEFHNLPRRFTANCTAEVVQSKMFWSKDGVFLFSAKELFEKNGNFTGKTIYIPWQKANLFTAWALLRLGYDVKIVRWGNLKY